MAQVLKEEVRDRIARAALRVFASDGFEVATMAEIARMAGVSTGNLYRYFASKNTLFAAVLPVRLARELKALIRRRVEALRGVKQIADLPEGAPWRVISEELVAFTIAHRLEAIVLLSRGKADGTELSGFSDQMAAELSGLAVRYARSVGASFTLVPARRFALDRIYRGFVDTMAALIAEHEDEAAIRAALAQFTTYHLAGMQAFIQESSP